MRRRARATGSGIVRAAIGRGAVLALLWWGLTEGAGGFGFGAIVVSLALAATFALAPPRPPRLSIAGLLRFIPFFLWQSLSGGIDVARRALSPKMPLAPAMFEYRLRLTEERARVLLASTMGLTPGTVSAELRADRLRLHVLDVRLPIERITRRVEARVAGIFGEVLQDY